jgi:hypothetical protein
MEAFVANGLIDGDPFSTHPNPGVRDLVDIESEGLVFRFRQRPNVTGPLGQFKDCFVETSQVARCRERSGANRVEALDPIS